MPLRLISPARGFELFEAFLAGLINLQFVEEIPYAAIPQIRPLVEQYVLFLKLLFGHPPAEIQIYSNFSSNSCANYFLKPKFSIKAL